jgi:hypothetical protein
VLAVHHGLIIGAFKADRWLPATAENRVPPCEGRWGFVGREAPKHIRDLYLDKRVELHAKGSQNPIRYVKAEVASAPGGAV